MEAGARLQGDGLSADAVRALLRRRTGHRGRERLLHPSGFAPPFRLLLPNPQFFPGRRRFIPIYLQGARREKRLQTFPVTNSETEPEHAQKEWSIPCFMEHFIVFPDGNRLMLLCLLAWSAFIMRPLRVLSLCGSWRF